MQTREREPAAEDRQEQVSLLNIADQISAAQHLSQAAYMAAQSLPREEREAMSAVLHVAGMHLSTASAVLAILVQRELSNAS